MATLQEQRNHMEIVTELRELRNAIDRLTGLLTVKGTSLSIPVMGRVLQKIVRDNPYLTVIEDSVEDNIENILNAHKED